MAFKHFHQMKPLWKKTVEDLGYITEKSSKNIFPNQV